MRTAEDRSRRRLRSALLAILLGAGAAVNPLAAQETRPAPEKKGAETPAESGRKLLNAVVKAVGEPPLATLKSLSWTSSEDVDPYGRNRKRSTKALVVFPDKMLIEWEIDGQSVKLCLDGNVGWQADPTGVQSLPADRVEDMRKSLLISTTPLLQQHARLTCREGPPKEFEGVSYRRLDVKRDSLPEVQLHVHPETHLVFHRKMEFPASRGLIVREEILSDYREVQGLKLPFRRVVYEDGKELLRISVLKYEINPAVDPARFRKPTNPGQ